MAKPSGRRQVAVRDSRGRIMGRAGDRRVQTALESARQAQAALDARIAAETAATAHIQAPTRPKRTPLKVVPVVPPVAPVRKAVAKAPPLDPWRKGTTLFSLADAREMVRQGYRVERVVQKTGFGPSWFDGLEGPE